MTRRCGPLFLKLNLLCAGLLFSLACPSIPAQTSMSEDLRHRNPAITWPAGYDLGTAPLFSHNDLLLPVPCGAAFQQLIDAEQWPSWLVFAKDVQTPGHGLLSKDITFSWSIFGKPIRSTVRVFDAPRQIGWLNENSKYYQAWLFESQPNGCRVTTEEIGVGEPARHAAAIGDDRTHRAHDLWLASLRWIAEGGTNLH